MSLAWTMVRHRFAAFAGTFVAIALGVAVVAGATTLWASSRPEAPARYGASPVLVHSPSVGTGRDGYPDHRSWTAAHARELAARLAALPGVTAAVADPAFYVQRVVGGRATGDPDTARSDGHAWSSAVLGGYRLTAGEAPRRAGEVALGGVAPGARIDVLTGRGPATWTVTGTVDGPGFYVADEAARALAAGVRVIGLTVTGDAEAVAAAAESTVGGDGLVFSGERRNELEDEAVTRTRWLGAQLLIAMVTLGGFVAVFVVASTCALSAAQRRREIGLLRAVGATPGQVVRLMYAETLVVAVLGGAVGVPLGALTAPLLAPPLVAAGLEPAGFSVSVQPLALTGSFLLGVVVALAGVWVAARRSSRIPALDALRDAAIDRRAMTAPRWIAGLVTAAAGGGLMAALPALPVMTRTSAALGAAMLLLVGAALLAPVVIVPLVRLVTWPFRRGATGMLLRESTLTGVRRLASTAAPVMLTVGFAALMTGMVATIEEAAGIDEAAELPATLVAAPDGTPGLAPSVAERQPGDYKLTTEVLVTIGATTGGRDASGEAGVSGIRLSAELRNRPESVAVGFPDGTTTTLKVTGTHEGPEDLVVLPRDLVREHDPAALAGVVLLDGPAVPVAGMKVLPVRAYVQELIDVEGRIIRIFLVVLIGLSAGYTGLAVANTLLMATSARRGEFTALRLAGGGTGHVLRLTTGEALLSVAVGSVLGGAVAAAALLGMRNAVEEELQQAVRLVVPWGQSGLVVLVCAAVAVAAASLPVLRTRPR
ncbi:ABC transporter permease [Nucisporomicrobium flavum]|uniref:ABC transporter permease n=1 Tax=Nucisporomicrobium flavum TaxID=2785915 RepID=UPI0018F582FE|nr:ABC transporter permease [Nucisporomicrobium flavum]